MNLFKLLRDFVETSFTIPKNSEYSRGGVGRKQSGEEVILLPTLTDLDLIAISTKFSNFPRISRNTSPGRVTAGSDSGTPNALRRTVARICRFLRSRWVEGSVSALQYTNPPRRFPWSFPNWLICERTALFQKKKEEEKDREKGGE